MHLRLGISPPSRCKCMHYFLMRKKSDEKNGAKGQKSAESPISFCICVTLDWLQCIIARQANLFLEGRKRWGEGLGVQ